MLLEVETLRGIKDGSISLAFRRWRRPSVKSGGTLLTPIGQLAIGAVERVELSGLTESEARAAGFPDLSSLRAQLTRRSEGDVYRVRLALAGPDPRISLRSEVPVGEELEQVLDRLRRLGAKTSPGPWAGRILKVIRERPAVGSAELADAVGMDRAPFKVNVRKLKGLGLTESLKIGYRLSPRGEAVLDRLRDREGEST
jgi:hypothetical protein